MHRTQAKLDEAMARQKALKIQVEAARRVARQAPRGPEYDAADKAWTELRWAHAKAKDDAHMWRWDLRRMQRRQALREAS
ncbi:hypothetical protein [Paracoccus sp. J55]|uniref:hypothetical protein n=1 Tax=Paracoccus sp. J55 TaxID=935849 RepID=UPI00049128CF|nr:hypothetical protein [Paracoccus sp. J55]